MKIKAFDKLQLLAAKRRMAERKDRIAQKLEECEYMPTQEVAGIMEVGIKTLENIPSKMASEFGLTQEQERRLQQVLDEARNGWAEYICPKNEKAPAK